MAGKTDVYNVRKGNPMSLYGLLVVLFGKLRVVIAIQMKP
jgi:hypothetical protein